MSKTLVVIPYFSAGSQGKEIDLAIAGWGKHFKEDYLLVVVGDYANVPGGLFVDCPQVRHDDDGNYLPHLDHANKFRKILDLFPGYGGFIYACDDMYAVNDFTLDDVKRLKYLEEDMNGNLLSPNGWERDMAKTRNICVTCGIPVRNWVCHLPVWFERDKFEQMYRRFDYLHNSFIVENVYYNLFHGGEDADLVDGSDRWRLGVFDQSVTDDIIWNAMKSKVWITNSNEGWSERLENLLKHHYGESGAIS